jgi:hypothetical protein
MLRAEQQVADCLNDLTTKGTATNGHSDASDWAGLNSQASRNPDTRAPPGALRRRRRLGGNAVHARRAEPVHLPTGRAARLPGLEARRRGGPPGVLRRRLRARLRAAVGRPLRRVLGPHAADLPRGVRPGLRRPAPGRHAVLPTRHAVLRRRLRLREPPAGGPPDQTVARTAGGDVGNQCPLKAAPAGAAAPGHAKPRLRLRVSPRRVRARHRTRFRFRVTARGKRVRGAKVRFAGKTKRTGRRGRATIVRRLHRRGLRRAVVRKRGFRTAKARVRVRRPRR